MMTLMGKEKPEDICEHLKEIIRLMIEHGVSMSHDFQGTYISCGKCDSDICLEAYGDSFNDEDIGE